MAFDWRKRKRPQGLRGLEPFCVGLNPPQAAAAGKPPFVAATFQFLKISCPFGTSLLKLLRVSRSALVGAFLSKPLLGTSAINWNCSKSSWFHLLALRTRSLPRSKSGQFLFNDFFFRYFLSLGFPHGRNNPRSPDVPAGLCHQAFHYPQRDNHTS